MIKSPSQFSLLWKASLVALLAVSALGTVAWAGESYAAQQVGDPDITIAYIDNTCGTICGASALIVFGALLLWWRRS